MSDKEFIDGLSAKAPHEKAPDFVKARISIKLADFAQYLRDLKAKEPDAEWLNADVKVAKSGNWYIERDTWKPEKTQEPATADEDSIPF
jgi:hypothetical protein